MRGGRITDLIDGLNNGVQGCIVSDCGIGTEEVIVDGARQTDDREVVFRGENTCSGQRTVTSDHHQRIDALCRHVVVGEFTPFGCFEFCAASRFENCTALLNNVADILCFERNDLVGDQTTITSHDAFDFKAVVNCGTSHRTDCSVHAWSIAARSQNTDTLDLCHNIPYLFYAAKVVIFSYTAYAGASIF